jgi:hypothetical protein
LARSIQTAFLVPAAIPLIEAGPHWGRCPMDVGAIQGDTYNMFDAGERAEITSSRFDGFSGGRIVGSTRSGSFTRMEQVRLRSMHAEPFRAFWGPAFLPLRSRLRSRGSDRIGKDVG